WTLRDGIRVEVALRFSDGALEGVPFGLEDRQKTLEKQAAFVVYRVSGWKVLEIGIARVMYPGHVHNGCVEAVPVQAHADSEILAHAALDQKVKRAPLGTGGLVQRRDHFTCIHETRLCGILDVLRLFVRASAQRKPGSGRKFGQFKFNAVPL